MAKVHRISKDAILKMALEKIEEYGIIFITDIVSFLPIGKSTFYEMFPEKSEEMELIKEKVLETKSLAKALLRKKMLHSDSPAHTAMLYRLMATPEELEALSMTKTVNETTHTVNIPALTWVDGSE